ncbi:MAG TPA: histidine kinase [Chitinophagaceae bacterium]|nr:histidine kinase [Chitinophagaceae bacterium]
MNHPGKIAALIIQFFICHICHAQKEKIDSLKKISLSLQDNLLVDCYNELCSQYSRVGNKDSASHYESLAFQKANSMNYAHGIAESYCNKAAIALIFSSDFPVVELLAKHSLNWYEKTINKKNVEEAYFHIAFALYAQGQFDNALQNFKECISWCLKNNNTGGAFVPASHITAAIYKDKGDYDSFFNHIKRNYEFALRNDNKAMLSGTLFQTAEMYMKLEDYEAALQYFRQAFRMDTRELENFRLGWDIWVKLEFAETFSNLSQFDSAWHYYNLFKPDESNEMDYRNYLVSTGECHFLQRNYKQALESFLKGLVLHKKLNDKNEVLRVLLDIAKTYAAQQNDTAALRYAREGLSIATLINARQKIRDGYGILYALFDHLNQKDSSAIYFRRYVTIKDALSIDQTKGKLMAYNYEQKIELFDNEKQIQQARLEKESAQKKILVISLIGLLLLGFITVRYFSLRRKIETHRREIAENDLRLQKLEAERTKAELMQQSTELEMQALRAQMNPHFIFNSLNSINRFILQNNKTQASEYLTKFSRLVRLILQNSQAALIPLESELESLQLYLELEAVRFDHHFEFKIKVEDDLDVSAIKVPPLIIQPYAENAIWHGLMHKEEPGHLEIGLVREDDILCCTIRDDGVGRKKASALKSKSASTHKSMGMRITADRIANLQQQKTTDNYIKITDLILADGSAGGTEILLKIPIANV